MPMTNFPQATVKFEIQTYIKPKNLSALKKTHVAFTGSPQRHPYDSDKVILVVDPYSSNTFYYEFKMDDVAFVEELPNLVNIDGEAISTARIWVKKMSIGVRCSPFVVEETGAISK